MLSNYRALRPRDRATIAAAPAANRLNVAGSGTGAGPPLGGPPAGIPSKLRIPEAS